MRRQGFAVATALGVTLLLLTLATWEKSSGAVELEIVGDDDDAEKIQRLEDEAKAKSIEGNIRSEASKVEQERAEEEEKKADAEKEKEKAADDKKEAHNYFARAKALASQSVVAHSAAKVAEQEALNMGKVFKLKTAVANLMQDRAEAEKVKAERADEDARAVNKRVAQIKAKIYELRREARAKSTEADARVEVAHKLLHAAKELSVKAKIAQEKENWGKPKTPVVSKEALKLIKRDALRVKKLLRKDTEELQEAESHLPKDEQDAEK